LNIFQEESVKEAIKSVSEKLNLSENTIKAILDYEYEKMNKERYL
jgi:DNA-binding NarL/FixJ family response regulator